MVWPHQCQVQGDDHFPTPTAHTIPDTYTIPAIHVQPAVDQHPKLLFWWAAFQSLFPKPVALHGVVVTEVQYPAFGLVEPHTTDLCPSIQSVQIRLQSLPTLKQINPPTQLGFIYKLTERALNPLIQTIDKDVKQDRSEN